MGRGLDAVDRTQRRFSIFGFPLAVIYKFFDDQGNYLAAIITYYAFIAIFPLLLLATSILGFVLQGNVELQESLLDSTLSQFPIVGDQLGRPGGLEGSTSGIVVGSLVATYGALGLGQAMQNALNLAWAVPRNSRPNPFLLRFKSMLLLLTAGLAFLAISVITAVAGHTEVLGESLASYRWPILLGSVLLNTGVFTLLFRLGAARSHSLRGALPGALVTAILWQSLQLIGTLYVTRVLNNTSAMNQTFALVLGLIGIVYIAAVMGVLGMEVNIVYERRLWPRALLTPFTDNVKLTDADRRAYASYARTQRHKGYEEIEIIWRDTEPDIPNVNDLPNTQPMASLDSDESQDEPLPSSEGGESRTVAGPVAPAGPPAPSAPAAPVVPIGPPEGGESRTVSAEGR